MTFSLGNTYLTPGVQDLMARGTVNPLALLSRHARCDWGEMSPEDRRANNRALTDGTRLFSAYQVTPDVRVWVITEADRSATTLLLPSEY